MKKVGFLLFISTVLFLFISCSSEKNIQFEIISQDIPMIGYEEGEYIIIESFSSFKECFPNFQEKEELSQISEDTFLNSNLIYFEYVSEPGIDSSDLNLKTIRKDSTSITYEIYTSGINNDSMTCAFKYYLVKMKTQDISNPMQSQVVVYNENTNLLCDMSIEYNILSDEHKMNAYEENSFVLIHNLDEFKEAFPNYQDDEELNRINEDTFLNSSLIYFEYAIKGTTTRDDFKIEKISKNGSNLTFYIFSSLISENDEDSYTISYLLKLNKNNVQEIENFKINYNLY